MPHTLSSQTLVADQSGDRLDAYLVREFSDYSRSYWTNMINHHYVTVNKQQVKPGYSVRSDDIIEILWPEVAQSSLADISILHQDSDVLVINKPAGMLVHSKGKFNPEFTVADYAINQGSELTGERAGIVHRLDRYTSGVMIIAKNQASLSFLQDQFAKRLVEKYYIAVVEGDLREEVLVDVELARSSRNPKTFEADKQGKPAQTVFQPIASRNGVTVVLAKPVTGRTHQIRAHAKHITHPIVGDEAYSSSIALKQGRFMLHAYCLDIILNSDMTESTKFFASLPKDMAPYIHNADIEQINQSIT